MTTFIKGVTSIVIPIANTDYPPAHYTGNCIGSIKYFTKLPYEIIVIDNASTCQLGGVKWEEIVDKYIKLEKNTGYTGGMNRGIQEAKGEYVCLMSSDVEVYDYWLEDMQEALNHVDLVMATPMYDLPYGRAKEALERRNEWLKNTNEHEWLRDFRDFSCVLAKKELFDKVGLLDEKLGSYSEDIDFVFRMQEMGLTAKSSKRVNTHHIGMASGYIMMQQGVKINEQMNKNKEYLKEKWGLDSYGIPKFMRERKEVSTPTTSKTTTQVKTPKVKEDGSFVVRTKETGDKVYLVKNNSVAWIENPETLAELEFSFFDVKMIEYGEFGKYKQVDSLNLKEQHLAKEAEKKKQEIKEETEKPKPKVDPVLGHRLEA